MALDAHNTQSKLCNSDRNLLKETVLNVIKTKAEKELSLFVTGKTGVGKSRLVNALVGKPGSAKEGRKRTEGCTDKVEYYTVSKNDINVRVWDSPGLQDRTVQDEDLYLEEVKQCGFDAMIYCCRMDIKRLTEEDTKAMRTLARVFGKEVWKKAVVALTFANLIEDPDGGDEKAYFEGELNHWKDAIYGFLRDDPELQLDSVVCDPPIPPIDPAGNYRKLILPTANNWLSELWLKCFLAMDVDASLALFLSSKDRVSFEGCRTPAEPNSTQDVASSLALATPSAIPRIFLNREQEGRFWKKLMHIILDFLKENKTLFLIISVLGTAILIGYFFDLAVVRGSTDTIKGKK